MGRTNCDVKWIERVVREAQRVVRETKRAMSETKCVAGVIKPIV